MQGISHGVPQGSILGPALFTIYLNNIPSIPDVCSLESYVDDSKLYLSFSVAEASNVIQQINKDLKKIASWCCYNSLLINPEKTKLLVLGTRQMLQKLPAYFHVTLLGKKITPSPSPRDLGLQVQWRIQGGWIGWISTPHFSVKKIRNVILFEIENKERKKNKLSLMSGCCYATFRRLPPLFALKFARKPFDNA